MSMSSWKKEFYTKGASSQSVQKSDLSAIQHSLKKWRGLTKENLQRHGLVHEGKGIVVSADPEHYSEFAIDDETCALCIKYCNAYGSCLLCPLSEVRGGLSCDSVPGFREKQSPYAAFSQKGNPKPMIKLLERVEAEILRESKRKV